MNEDINITVEASFIEDQSDPDEGRFVFAYTVTIENQGQQATRLLARHWVIEDANGRIEELHGEGIIGQQPIIMPGSSYTYTSGTILETDIGTMQGSYQMLSADGKPFDAEIPVFLLSVPRVLH